MKLHLFSYIRVSGKSQINGEGPDRQRDTIKDFCGATLGEFFEEGVSGTVEGMDRPKFSEMVEAIECRRLNGQEIDGIVVERMDRLARDLMVQELLLKLCREKNIKVFCADRGEFIDVASDGGDPTRKLIRQVMGALAEWEKSQIVLKLRKGKEAVKAREGFCGVPPVGKKNAVEELMVKQLQAFYKPEQTLKEVADHLNAWGFVTREGSQFSPKTAWRLLKQVGLWVRKDPVAYRLKNFGNKRINAPSI